MLAWKIMDRSKNEISLISSPKQDKHKALGPKGPGALLFLTILFGTLTLVSAQSAEPNEAASVGNADDSVLAEINYKPSVPPPEEKPKSYWDGPFENPERAPATFHNAISASELDKTFPDVRSNLDKAIAKKDPKIISRVKRRFSEALIAYALAKILPGEVYARRRFESAPQWRTAYVRMVVIERLNGGDIQNRMKDDLDWPVISEWMRSKFKDYISLVASEKDPVVRKKKQKEFNQNLQRPGISIQEDENGFPKFALTIDWEYRPVNRRGAKAYAKVEEETKPKDGTPLWIAPIYLSWGTPPATEEAFFEKIKEQVEEDYLTFAFGRIIRETGERVIPQYVSTLTAAESPTMREIKATYEKYKNVAFRKPEEDTIRIAFASQQIIFRGNSAATMDRDRATEGYKAAVARENERAHQFLNTAIENEIETEATKDDEESDEDIAMRVRDEVLPTIRQQSRQAIMFDLANSIGDVELTTSQDYVFEGRPAEVLKQVSEQLGEEAMKLVMDDVQAQQTGHRDFIPHYKRLDYGPDGLPTRFSAAFLTDHRILVPAYKDMSYENERLEYEQISHGYRKPDGTIVVGDATTARAKAALARQEAAFNEALDVQQTVIKQISSNAHNEVQARILDHLVRRYLSIPYGGVLRTQYALEIDQIMTALKPSNMGGILRRAVAAARSLYKDANKGKIEHQHY